MSVQYRCHRFPGEKKKILLSFKLLRFLVSIPIRLSLGVVHKYNVCRLSGSQPWLSSWSVWPTAYPRDDGLPGDDGSPGDDESPGDDGSPRDDGLPRDDGSPGDDRSPCRPPGQLPSDRIVNLQASLYCVSGSLFLLLFPMCSSLTFCIFIFIIFFYSYVHNLSFMCVFHPYFHLFAKFFISFNR